MFGGDNQNAKTTSENEEVQVCILQRDGCKFSGFTVQVGFHRLFSSLRLLSLSSAGNFQLVERGLWESKNSIGLPQVCLSNWQPVCRILMHEFASQKQEEADAALDNEDGAQDVQPDGAGMCSLN